MKDYKVFLSKKNETWQQAIERYQRFCEAEMKEYFDTPYPYRFINNPAYQFHQLGAEPAEKIQSLEDKFRVKIPVDLADLLVHTGAFRIGNGMFELFHGSKEMLTLVEVMQAYGYDKLLEQMGEGMLKSMNQYYFFFGVTFPQTDGASFLYFNKAMEFGKMPINDDNHAEALKKIFPSMFNGSADKFTLDDLISNQIDRVIINGLTVKGYID